jgi:hypothetical protein
VMTATLLGDMAGWGTRVLLEYRTILLKQWNYANMS